MKITCIGVVFITLTYAIPVVLPHYLQLRPNRTLWPNDALLPGYKNYEEVSLVKPRFKSKKLAGLEWSPEARPDSSSAQTRHLEWFTSSEDDTQSADTTEKNFLSNFFEDDEEKEAAPMKNKSVNDILRQHHRKKYVKVDRMIFPLLLAYKLKFFTMIPLLIGALVLLVTSTGLAGFFFALFAAAAGLHHHKGTHG